jgi:hypothetical protein
MSSGKLGIQQTGRILCVRCTHPRIDDAWAGGLSGFVDAFNKWQRLLVFQKRLILIPSCGSTFAVPFLPITSSGKRQTGKRRNAVSRILSMCLQAVLNVEALNQRQESEFQAS